MASVTLEKSQGRESGYSDICLKLSELSRGRAGIHSQQQYFNTSFVPSTFIEEWLVRSCAFTF